MANRIKGLDGGSIGPDSSNPIEKIRITTPVNSGSSGAPASTPRSDSVHITDSARTLASLSQAVNDSPDVDMNRVSAVQQALATGVYRINPERIANNMLALEQDLGSAKQK
ncbi:MAG TPA: flagellar biosynthesis anti-sigma factor FlgM [Steroidobacteraceae bacterium]|nr:flagellar biosynthesis anti-sigma factor FlgM [Steroidobacteraceae bacterium]